MKTLALLIIFYWKQCIYVRLEFSIYTPGTVPHRTTVPYCTVQLYRSWHRKISNTVFVLLCHLSLKLFRIKNYAKYHISFTFFELVPVTNHTESEMFVKFNSKLG